MPLSRRIGVVNPVGGGWLGEGGVLSRAGIPTIFARRLHELDALDAMTAAQLKGA